MRLPSLEIIIPVFIVMGNLYPIFSGIAKDNFSNNGKTRKIYNVIVEEIEHLEGAYKQYGGRVNRSFIVEAEFPNLNNDYDVNILKKIAGIGFKLEKIEKNNFYLLCNDESGFWIARKPILNIHYKNKMPDCEKMK